jgi:aminopeptidase N
MRGKRSTDRGAGAPPDLQPGVSEALAVERAGRISEIRYEIAFTLPASRAAKVAGRETIAFVLADASSPLVIDFNPEEPCEAHTIIANGAPVEASLVDGHLIVPPPALRQGENSVFIEFDAGDAPLHRGEDLAYTLFVPARAHEAFPCFDQPDLKARFRLSLDVPEGWEAASNGREEPRRPGSGIRTFAATEPLPTYLFAFIAGRLSIERAERGGRELRMLHREPSAEKIADNREALFDLHASALLWLERYTGIPYPFGKFDFALIPALELGGMEHPGVIFYDAARLILEGSATQGQILERANTIAHETAHLWFGDLVTMRWFNDVWMKEVFASFMAAKIVVPSFPAIDHELRFLLAHYPPAYNVDRTAGANAVRQPLANLSEAGSLYGDIIYHKAPIVMRQLEAIVGADTLRDALRDHLSEHAFGNASWMDLVGALDRRSPEDLGAWSRAWVEEQGRVVVTTDLRIEGGQIARLSFEQRDPCPGRGLLWRQKIEIALSTRGVLRKIPVHLDQATVDVVEARGLPAPDFVLLNGGGIAYGELHLDEGSLRWLVSRLPEIDDPLTRGSAWITLWDAMLSRAIAPSELADLALRCLPEETDELLLQRILGYLSRAFWRFSLPSEWAALASRVERALRTGLLAAVTPSLKSAYFSALRDMALTPSTLAWLARVERGEEQIPGLSLTEADHVALLEELCVREVPGARQMLRGHIDRTEDPDRRARLSFVAPALSDDALTRDAFFASLGDVANRRREPWVLDGLRCLHHPLRAASSEKYLLPSLEMLEAIQRTGGVFLPKQWMDRTLGGHQSVSAARIVRAFLDGLPPGYPERLRRIILSSADELFRAAAMNDGGPSRSTKEV